MPEHSPVAPLLAVVRALLAYYTVFRLHGVFYFQLSLERRRRMPRRPVELLSACSEAGWRNRPSRFERKACGGRFACARSAITRPAVTRSLSSHRGRPWPARGAGLSRTARLAP
eukprot:7386470-Prymnesium_polylepis.4